MVKQPQGAIPQGNCEHPLSDDSESIIRDTDCESHLTKSQKQIRHRIDIIEIEGDIPEQERRRVKQTHKPIQKQTDCEEEQDTDGDPILADQAGIDKRNHKDQ